MDVLTVAGAARRLGISPRHLLILLETSVLTGEQLPSGEWIVATDSVRAYKLNSSGLGRPWSTRTAWAALAELDGTTTDLLTPPTLTQLRRRLRTISPTALAQKVSKRNIIHRLTCQDPFEIADQLIPTRTPSTFVRGPVTDDQPHIVYGYLKSPTTPVDQFITENDLTRRIEGNVHLYETPPWVTSDLIGPASNAADLANSHNDIGHLAGINELTTIRDHWILNTDR